MSGPPITTGMRGVMWGHGFGDLPSVWPPQPGQPRSEIFTTKTGPSKILFFLRCCWTCVVDQWVRVYCERGSHRLPRLHSVAARRRDAASNVAGRLRRPRGELTLADAARSYFFDSHRLIAGECSASVRRVFQECLARAPPRSKCRDESQTHGPT